MGKALALQTHSSFCSSSLQPKSLSTKGPPGPIRRSRVWANRHLASFYRLRVQGQQLRELDSQGPEPSTLPSIKPPAISITSLWQEITSGDIWNKSKEGLPRVPWGVIELAQVSAGGAAVALVAAALLSSTSASRDADLAAGAARHLGQEVIMLAVVSLLLWGVLGRVQPRSKGAFQYHLSSDWAVTVAGLCCVLFPLVDPGVYTLWKALLEGLTGQAVVPNPFTNTLHSCGQQGDLQALLLHFVATCTVGPIWEETFWRGFFLYSLSEVLPLPACVAISSVGFALLHLSPANVMPILILSSISDVLFLRSATLGPSLALHMAWNAYQFIAVAGFQKDAFV